MAAPKFVDGKWTVDGQQYATYAEALAASGGGTSLSSSSSPGVSKTPATFTVQGRGSIPLANGQTYTPNTTAQDAFTSLNSQKPTSMVDAHGNITPVGETAATPTAPVAASTGSGSGSGGSGPVAAAARGARAFPKLSVSDLFKQFHAGRITEEELRAELVAIGYNPREMDLLFAENAPEDKAPQEDAASAFFGAPSGLNPFDVPGRIAANDFGSTTPQSINNRGLMLGNVAGANAGDGIIYGVNPDGTPFVAGYQINGNVYDPTEVANLNQQRGLYTGNSGFDTQVGAIGAYNQLQAADQAMFPDATPSNINRSILDLFQPANPHHDPAVSDVEDADNPLPRFASGGSLLTQDPIALVNQRTGKMEGQFGEAGPEQATFTPLGQPQPTQHAMSYQDRIGARYNSLYPDLGYKHYQDILARQREAEARRQQAWRHAGGQGPAPAGWQPGMPRYYNFAYGGTAVAGIPKGSATDVVLDPFLTLAKLRQKAT